MSEPQGVIRWLSRSQDRPTADRERVMMALVRTLVDTASNRCGVLWCASVVTMMLAVGAAAIAAEPVVLRSRLVDADSSTVRAASRAGEPLRLRLFEDADFTALVDVVESDRFNGFVWRGRLEGVEAGWAVLVVDRDCIDGTVWAPPETYRVRCLGSGRHVIDQMEVEGPEGRDYVLVAPSADAPDTSAGEGLEPSASAAMGTSAETEIDLMVVYTRRAARKLARTEGRSARTAKRVMKAQIRLAVAVANTALDNSEVDIRLRLVRMRQVGFRASGTAGWDLSRIYDPDDGVLDRVHYWRERFGADLVATVLDDFDSGRAGLGYLVTPRHDDPGSLMLSVVRYDLLWWVVLAHEVGHNLGLAHDRDNDTTTAAGRAFAYSRGYRDRRAGFHTVMSYRRGCPDCRWAIPHYSNPDVDWEGRSSGSTRLDAICGDGVEAGPKCGRRTGTARANNARSLNQTREFYASVFSCRVDCSPTQ